jgi:hypothetical protein
VTRLGEPLPESREHCTAAAALAHQKIEAGLGGIALGGAGERAPRQHFLYNRFDLSNFAEKPVRPHFTVLPCLRGSATVELLRVYARGTFEVVAGRRSR